MGTKNNPGQFDCYEAAEPDEPMFILLARDPIAPILVELWASLRLVQGCTEHPCKSHGEKVSEARGVAISMRNWKYLKERDS